MQLSRILREGFIAGLIGAAAVALWFLVVDVIAGRPFFTPAMLGSAVFWGVHDPAQVVIEYSRIIGYTMIHVSAFIIVGTISAVLAAEVEVAPHTLYLVVVFWRSSRSRCSARSPGGTWRSATPSRPSAWAITCGGCTPRSRRRSSCIRWGRPTKANKNAGG